ncbi:MAG: SepM family pheromone-processing serine protease [Vulcanimicrobiaceae bacterium]
MGGRRDAAYVWSIVALAVLAALSVIATPYYLLAPGSAVDLSQRIAVAGHAAPTRRFFLTDVVLARASVLMLAAAVVPGVRIVRRDDVVPPGQSASGFDRTMLDAMASSQNVAAIVAERAAGYRVTLPHPRVCVVDIRATPGGEPVLQPGDCIVRVATRTIGSTSDLVREVARLHRAPIANVRVVRDGHTRELAVPTVPLTRGVQLGVRVREEIPRANLPVAVRYTVRDIAGSSGGLMFALQIYAALRGERASRVARSVAGTGTIALDGRVGPIEGTRQKFIAATRVGATTFLVPAANASELAGERGMRIVPIRTFADALAALR